MEGSSEGQSLLRCEAVAHENYASVEVQHSGLSPSSTERAVIDKVLAATEARRKSETKVLYGALIFCFVFMIVEFFSGIVAHSLALLTDASHLLTDVGMYALSIMSLKAASKTSCGKYSYGWHRAEVIGTLVSVFSIWALVVWICIEGVTRMWNVMICSRVPGMMAQQQQQGGKMNGAANRGLSTSPEEVCEKIDAPIMLLVGLLGLVVNIVCAAILHYGGSHGHSHFGLVGHSHSHSHGEGEDDHEHHHEHDHHHSHGDHKDKKGEKIKAKKGFAVHAALLHALGDCVQSIGVILAGAFIYTANRINFGVSSSPHSVYNIADPMCSLLFAVVTLNMTRPLFADILGILMESTPPGVDYDALKTALLEIDGVVSVHDLHVWSLSAEYTALSVHLVADDAALVLRKAQYTCEVVFGIPHTTIQVDTVLNGADLCHGACANITAAPSHPNRPLNDM